jgi:hypothetical protein
MSHIFQIELFLLAKMNVRRPHADVMFVQHRSENNSLEALKTVRLIGS